MCVTILLFSVLTTVMLRGAVSGNLYKSVKEEMCTKRGGVIVVQLTYSPVANMTHLDFVYKGFFLTVSKSLFSADSKSGCSQTQKVERFSKNR